MAIDLSPIRAIEFQILRSAFEVLDIENPRREKDSISFGFHAHDLVLKDDGSETLQATLDFMMNQDDDTAGYRIDISVRGLFSATYYENGGSRDDFENFMKVNAFNLLYAFIRSHVQMLSSMSPAMQITLPCLDVASIAKVLATEQDEQEEMQ